MRTAVLAVPLAAAVLGVAGTGASAQQPPNFRVPGDGLRTYLWENGDSFTGEFRNGRPNGPGAFRTGNGQVHEGIWQDGCLVNETGRIAVFTRLSDCPTAPPRRRPALPRPDFR
jgi:hypothetical protein